MTKTSKRAKKLAAQIPQTEEALNALIADTLKAQTARESTIAKRDSLLLKVRERIEKKHGFDKSILDDELRIAHALELLEFWAVTHKKDFGDARSITRAGARLGWRLGNWQLPATKKAAEAAVDFLQGVVTRGSRDGASERQKARGVLASSFLRIKTTLNKERAVEERKTQGTRVLMKRAGLEFTQEETFYLDPEREGQTSPILTT